MRSFAFRLFCAAVLSLVILFWCWQHWRAQGDWTEVELAMSQSTEQIGSHRRGDVVFLADGHVLFDESNRMYPDGARINLCEESGIKAWRGRGYGKILFVRRPDGTIERYQFVQHIWLRLVPCERRVGLMEGCLQYLRHSGLTAFATIPEKFLETVLTLPAFLFIVALPICLIVFILGLLFSLLFPSFADTPTVMVPTRIETTSQAVLLKTEVADYANGLAFLSDRKLVSAGGPYISIWGIQNLTRIHTEEAPGDYYPMISSIAASPCAQQIAVVVDGDVVAWEERRGWIARPPPYQTGMPSAVRLGGVPTPTYGPALRVSPEEFSLVVYSPDGQVLAAVGHDSTYGIVELLDGLDLRHITTLEMRGYLSSVAFGFDGQHLAAATSDERVYVYDVSTQKTLLTATLEPPADRCGTASGAGAKVGFSPTENLLATAARGVIHFWDGAQCTHIGSVDVSGRAEWLSFLPDRKVVALIDGELNVIDISTKTVLAIVVPAIPCSVGALSPDGEMIALSGLNDRIQLLRLSEVLAKAKPAQKGV